MPDCPTPDRARYDAENIAWANLLPGNLPYRCRCGRWHNAPRDEAMRHRTAGR